MTKIMDRAKEKATEDERDQAAARERRERDCRQRALAQAQRLFGANPDEVLTDPDGNYRGTVRYEDVTIGFTEDDSFTRFFLPHICSVCKTDYPDGVYSLASLAYEMEKRAAETEPFVCWKCEMARQAEEQSAWASLSPTQKEVAAKLYKVLLEVIGLEVPADRE